MHVQHVDERQPGRPHPVESHAIRVWRSGSVSRQRPNLTLRSSALSSGLTVGALIERRLPWQPRTRPQRLRRGCSDGEVVGVAGKPTGDDSAWQRRLDRRLLGAAFEHAADDPNFDGFVLERASARGIDASGAPISPSQTPDSDLQIRER